VTKDPEERREELLDVALQLCRTHGYEAMNVAQITEAAQVAKGTFYHYFATKDAMLEQLVRRFGDALFDHLSDAAVAGSGADRIRSLMVAASQYKLNQADITYASFLYADGNVALRHRLFATWRERARQMLFPAIRDGAADGSLSMVDAEAATDIVLLLWFEAADHLWLRALATTAVDDFVTVMLNGATAISQAQERILGVTEGTFSVPLGTHGIELTRQLYRMIDRSHS